MQTHIVRQPIIGVDKSVLGCQLIYQDKGLNLYNQDDVLAANAIEDFFTRMDSQHFTDENNIFITFTPNLLLRSVPKIFAPSSLVIEVTDNCIVHPEVQKTICAYAKEGYRIAVKDFEFSPRYFSLLGVVDYIKINMENADEAAANLVKVGKNFGKKIIAYNVNSSAAYEKARACGCQYFQGTAVAAEMASQVNRMDHLQSNFFQLTIAVTRDEPDIDEITEIISRDVTLAFSLIKLVNSAYFALRNSVRSVKQALVVLGLGQLKQWVYLLSFKKSENQFTDEIIKLSFLRANFCSELSQVIPGMALAKSDAYLLGMFSTLGMLLEVSLEDSLCELPICDEIRVALIQKEGKAGTLYKLILAYEEADWATVESYAEELNLNKEVISQKYMKCIEYVTKIWNSLTQPYRESMETV